jgi:hypothetical protein
MPLPVSPNAPTLCIRREAYEASGLSRAALDVRLGLTDNEFRVEGSLILIGPIYAEDGLEELFAELEGVGLRHYDDFFELSGNWPEWLQVYAAAR